MRSRAARWTFVAVAWIALGAASYFLLTSQQTISASASAVRAIDLHAREADDALADLRVGQQAYVASGQGVAFWMPKVAATLESVNAAITALRESAGSPEARTAVEQATAAVAEFVEVDKRARDYVRSGQTLMAGDVIFTEGGQLAAVAVRQVETARQAEHQAFDAREAGLRRQQAMVAGVAAGVAGLIALLLGASGARADDTQDEAVAGGGLKFEASLALGDEGVVSHAKAVPPAAPPAHARGAVMMKATADLATDFGRVRDAAELERLLARAADLLDATGLVVWMTDGSTLRPVLAHGYSPAMLAKMPSVPRSADNAAAAACRTGTLQIVLSKPGGSPGAIAAPILAAEGCVGALTAEIKNGGEGAEAVQAVAVITAAHLAGVLAAAPAEAAAPEQPKAAASQ